LDAGADVKRMFSDLFKLRADPAVRAFFKEVRTWLRQRQNNTGRLFEWLQGYHLPSDAYQLEPYAWLLHALPPDGSRFQLQTELSQSTAEVLRDIAELAKHVRRPAPFYRNAFWLAAGLRYPNVLAKVLVDLYRQEINSQSALFQDSTVRDAFRAALVMNQCDAQMREIWESLVMGDSDPILSKGRYDGFTGLLMMPATHETLGKPYLPAIGFALKAIGVHLEPKQDRRPRFRRLLQRTLETYPGWPTWNRDLIRQSIQKQWPVWAVECLPSLFVLEEHATPMKSTQREAQTAYLWGPVYACVAECDDNSEKLDEYFDGNLVLANLSSRGSRVAAAIATQFEPGRTNNPYPSERSTIGIALDTISALEESTHGANQVHRHFQGHPKRKLALQRARDLLTARLRTIA
jgi:hypothetical protein